MARTKKVKSSGRFGARYGKKVRERVVKVESKQHSKQKCPFCGKLGVKREAKGIWKCPKCKRRFASNVYYLGNSK